MGEEEADEIDQLREKLAQLAIPHESKLEVARHINRLEKTSPDSMEATVLRNYLDYVLALPWGKHTIDNLDLKLARAILDEDHYGMQEY